MSDDQKILNIALVGAGFHATTTILPTLCHLPFQLQAVVDLDEAKANAVATQFGCKAYSSTEACYAVEKTLDAVLLVVGPAHHPRLMSEAVQAGLHVWAEKPAAKTAEEIDAIIPTIEASGLVAMVGYKKAFMPAVDKILEIMARPDSGRLLQIVGQYPIGIPGAWRANSSHPLACMLACGGPVKRLRRHLCQSGGGSLSLEFVNGAIGTLIMANKTRGLSERYQIFCEETHVELEDGNHLAWHRGQKPGADNRWVGPGDDHGSIHWKVQNCYARKDNRLEMTQGFHHELFSFYQHILNGEQAERGSLAFARALTEIDDVVDTLDHDDWVDCQSADWRITSANAALAL